MSTARTIPLAEAGGELTTTQWGHDIRLHCVMFTCPVCKDHKHLVPYEPGGKATSKVGGRLVWANPSGSTLEDITLAPSYLSKTGRCRTHVFIRGGQLQILGDTQKLG